ncbi:MAG: glycosyl transferase, partial [Pseudomonadota bacterium]
MKRVIHLIDDPRPGGIQSLLSDMSESGYWSANCWAIKTVDPRLPICLGARYDVIVVHFSMAWRKLLALMLIRLKHPSSQLIIVEHHYTRSFERQHVTHRARFKALLLLAYSLADRVVAVSEAQA